MAEPRHPRVVVFDFDGTLLDSNAAKRDAFFQLFPDPAEQHPAVAGILHSAGEESRYVILRRILERLGERDEDRLAAEVERLAERYSALALEGAASCREIPGASALLARFAPSHSLYVSSGTPLAPLRTLIEMRGWTAHFKGIFGYPQGKVDTLRHISSSEACAPAAMLVVGDGASDERAAMRAGCDFFPVRDEDALLRLAGRLA